MRAFEVECTTSMTSGLQRGSSLPVNVSKTMVIPEERERDFERKMKSPLFSEHFEGDNWSLLFFNAFIQAYGKTKARTSLDPLLGQKKRQPSRRQASKKSRLSRISSASVPSLSRHRSRSRRIRRQKNSRRW
jgi:hypothetical protein